MGYLKRPVEPPQKQLDIVFPFDEMWRSSTRAEDDSRGTRASFAGDDWLYD